MYLMTSDEIDAYNVGINQIMDEIDWLLHHFGKQLDGYSKQRLGQASYALGTALINGETEG